MKKSELLLACMLVLLSARFIDAQGRGGRGEAGPPKTAKAAAPVDLTGYWVSQISTDWRFRAVVPPKGDFAGFPLNPAGKAFANEWDPAKDEAAGEQCKRYGAPALMRLPGRLHITWQDEQTLKVEMDNGQQTRLFYFAEPQSKGVDWQGVSRASWEFLPGAVTETLAVRGTAEYGVGSLKVVTTNLKPGYLRGNGIPYSDKAVLTEYFDRVAEPNGDALFILTTTIEDPTYLVQPVLISTHFKKQADATGWNPSTCTTR
jgi:hypothetical protein